MPLNKLLNDSEWSIIDGELCNVIKFTPLATIQNEKVQTFDITTPYASVTLKCKKLQEEIDGFITHKIDFEHLWKAFQEKAKKHDTEVLIVWSIKRYKNKAGSTFSVFMPKLHVMLCSKGAFDILINSKRKNELRGEAWVKAIVPIIEWKPDIME